MGAGAIFAIFYCSISDALQFGQLGIPTLVRFDQSLDFPQVMRQVEWKT